MTFAVNASWRVHSASTASRTSPRSLDTLALLHRHNPLLHDERLGAIRGIDACGIRSRKSCSSSTKDLCQSAHLLPAARYRASVKTSDGSCSRSTKTKGFQPHIRLYEISHSDGTTARNGGCPTWLQLLSQA
jgi:hypothetical protein